MDNWSQHKQLMELREVMENVLREQNRDRFGLQAFIIVRLKQFNIHENEPKDILNESAKRVKSQIDSGKTIENMPAYIRATAFNIIREYSRKQRQNYQVQRKLFILDSGEYLDNELYHIPPEIRLQLRAAWNKLALRYRVIVYNRAVKGYTFREIANELCCIGIENTSDSQTVNKITRQYHRAILRLSSQIDKSNLLVE
jgi:DNA-directed RNA polymerase specialized sigma24 family protein